MSPWCLLPSLGSILLRVHEQMWFEDFWYEPILAILNLHVAPTPPWWPSWISEQKDFSNSESLMLLRCLPSSFGSFRLRVWKMLFEEFQDSCRGGYPGFWNGTILAILNFYVLAQSNLLFEKCRLKNFKMAAMALMPSIVWAQSALRFGRRFRSKNFKMVAVAAILDVRK